ncbi:hypothetical protein D3C75_663290 [compost metagenome]
MHGGKYIGQMLKRIELIGFVQTLYIGFELIGSMQVRILALTEPDCKQSIAAEGETLGMLETFTFRDTFVHQCSGGIAALLVQLFSRIKQHG